MKFHKILTVEEQVRKLRKRQEKIAEKWLHGPNIIMAEDLAYDAVKGQEFIEAFSEMTQLYAMTAMHLEPEKHVEMTNNMAGLASIWQGFCEARHKWAVNQGVLESKNYCGPPKPGKRVDVHV